MSNLDPTPSLTHLGTTAVAPRPVHERFAAREAMIGPGQVVRRLLPNLGRRMVGAWCFVDHYGPNDIADIAGTAVPPHPHLGLQTVSWLRAGEMHHRDSLGNSAVIGPGELGLMTAGRGIAHAEHSPLAHSALLHGTQLWVALPTSAASVDPSWEHHTSLPALSNSGASLTVFLGTLSGETSPGTTYSDLVGVSVTMPPGGRDVIAIEPDFEYAALVLSGSVLIDDDELEVGTMLYLGTGRGALEFSSPRGTEFLLLGGVPFDERIVMWWNFVGASNDEIVQARAQWVAGERFGEVLGAGERLTAPPLPPGTLKAGGATR